MNQSMRPRRIAGGDHRIEDPNNGFRHEHDLVENGLLHEGDLFTDSYGGKLHPRTVPVLVDSLRGIVTALHRGKFGLRGALATPPRRLPRPA